MTLYAGTSGFSYATWKGGFYPASLAGAKMLAFYSQRLNGVEMNGSFYQLPPVASFENWASAVPPEFRFCMKASRGLTYSAEGFDRVGLAALFGSRVRSLGGRLGPVLIQFPPTRPLNLELLEGLLGAADVPCAVEFRHKSWFCDDTYRVLRRHGAALVVTDEEKWPRAPVVETAPFAYYRLRRDYTTAQLGRWMTTLRTAKAAHDDVHVYFKHETAGPARAERVLAKLA